MEKAVDYEYLQDRDYDRIVVDLHADWKANAKGEFGDSEGEGFECSTICIPAKARVMLNMNGHTIDRGLGDRNQFDGEVICIDEKADVIINGGKYGDITKTRYYVIDEETNEIAEIKHNALDSEADVTYGTKSCYKNTETGQYFYIFTDRIQPNIAEKYERKIALTFFGGEITETLLAEKSEITDMDTEETTISFKDAEGNEISEEEYRGIASKVFKGFEPFKVDFDGFKGYDSEKNELLINVSDQELTELLRDSFSKFRLYQ